MLVLSRKTKESIRLKFGSEIVWITVVDRDPARIRLGFEAPPEVEISREELLPIAEQRKQK